MGDFNYSHIEYFISHREQCSIAFQDEANHSGKRCTMDKDIFNKPTNDLIGDILKEYTKTGSMDDLKGAGKPISEEYFSGDIFQHFQKIAKDAGYKPHWLKLQHEIRDELNDIAQKYTTGEKEGLQFRVTKVNDKIMQYNKACPPPMQKGMVRLETIDSVSSRW